MWRRQELNKFFGLGTLLAGLGLASGQVTVTSNPVNGATGVSTTAPVVFTFSAPVLTNTAATFYSLSPFGAYPVTSVWNANSNVLACIPAPPFPANIIISWVVNGQDTGGNAVTATGSFSTGNGSDSGTNAITTFSVGKLVYYDQYSSAAPTLDTNFPYLFEGSTSLASNRSASSISLTLATGSVSNLTQLNPGQPENWSLSYHTTNSATFNAMFPQGNYTFFVSATASNQTVLDTLPASMGQPNAPDLTNYTAAQAINVSQPFTLHWDAFTGATATDFVYVVVGNVWQTPSPGTAGALSGLTTSATIPAGTLQASSNYPSGIGFYHGIVISNASFAVVAYRATLTRFNLSTASGTLAPVLANGAWSGGSFGFDINTSPSQTLTVVSTTNCALPMAQWQTLLTTNSPGARVHITDPHSNTNKSLFYRARNGP